MTSPTRPNPNASGTATLQSLRLITFSFIGAIVIIAVIGWSTVFTGTEMPPPGIIWLLIALAVLAGAISMFAPNSTKPLPATTPADVATERAVGAFRSLVFIRLAVCEAVGLLSFALGVALVPDAAWTAVIGCALSLVLLAVFAIPNRRTASQLQRRLERDGARTRLVQTLFGTTHGSSATGPRPPDSGFGITSR